MTSTPAIRRPTLTEMITDLCDTTTHHETYYIDGRAGPTPRIHDTLNAPLITQLADAVTPSSSTEAGIARPSASRPTARLDAIDTAIRIDHEARSLLQQADTIQVLRWVAALAKHADYCARPKPQRRARAIVCCTHHRIEDHVHRWWIWARVTTGWDAPAMQPDNTCPLCGKRGTLRVRLTEQLATCINDTCRETWDPDTIGILGKHITWENDQRGTPRPAPPRPQPQPIPNLISPDDHPTAGLPGLADTA